MEEVDKIVKDESERIKVEIFYKTTTTTFQTYDELITFINNEIPIWKKTLTQDDFNQLDNYIKNILHFNNNSQFLNNVRNLLNSMRTFSQRKTIAYSKSPVGKYISRMGDEEAKGFLEYLTKRPILNNQNVLLSEKISGVFYGLLYEKGYVKKKDIQELLESPSFVFDEFQKDYEENIEKLDKKNQIVSQQSDSLEEFIETTKNNTENVINIYRKEWEDRVENLISEKRESIEALELKYTEKLKLKGPTEYWESLSKRYILIGSIWFVVTMLIGLAGGLSIWAIADRIDFGVDQDITNSVQKYLLVAVLISLTFYLLSQSMKICLSQFHLSSDYKEREQITLVYLALLEENKGDGSVSKEDKQIILQSIFSRSESGLIKGDSGPVMPNNMINQIMKKI